MKVPEKLKNILDKAQKPYEYLSVADPFIDILESDELYFFREYTDHGIKHIENTLQYAENLIAEDTFQYLTPDEVGVLLLSVVLHDIGMHTNAEMFKNMIDGKYDDLVGLFPNEKKWKDLWKDFLYDSQYWGEEKKKNVFGKSDYNILIPDLSDLQGLTEYDKKLIGEFIRIHHCRIAHEVSINGYIGKGTIPFLCEDRDIDSDYVKIAGVVARSHGMDVRDTFDYLEGLSGDMCTPLNIHAVYLMVLLRLADYLQIDSSRTSKTRLKINTLYSPYSQQEHNTHLSIKDVQFKNADKEKIVIQANPKDAQTYVKIEGLVEDIQKEFDRSWAILGEVYTDYNYKLRYRRITTNITNEKYKSKLEYVPEQFGFRYNNDLFKLLIAPLYGDNPLYGVRELVQNAVDACRLCMNDESFDEEPYVIVEVDTKKSLFTITDTGKGMDLYEIKNYFLTIGSSYNDNIDWKKTRDQEHIYRTGRFGIGVLAAFLLGPEMTVVTRKRNEDTGYCFTTSLNGKFIQIKKNPLAAYGTKIEIKCDETCIEYFKKKNRWYRWYIDSNPKVEYYIDARRIDYKVDLNEFKILDHSSNLYGAVLWKPFSLFAYNYENKESLFCNGFNITKKTRKKEFSNNMGILPMFEKIHIPGLVITDKYNVLPLNLQRNNIEESVIYDFEPELSKSIFLDLMCQLMAIETHIALEHTDIFNFHSSGFSLNTNYTKSCIKERDEINFISSTRPASLLSEILRLLSLFTDHNYIIHFLNPHTSYLYDFLPSPKEMKIDNEYYAVHDSFHSMYRKSREFENAVLNNYNNWQLLTPINLESEKEKILKEIIDLSNANISVIRIEEIEKSSIPETLYDDLFEKYMNRDPVIPYEVEERKKKFPLLFQDYSEVIEQYRNIWAG